MRPDTAGERVVAAVGRDSDDYHVVFIDRDGALRERSGLTAKAAARLVDFSIDMLFEDVLEARLESKPRRWKGGAWLMSAMCPDGRRRTFTVKRKRRPDCGRSIPADVRFSVLEAAGFTCRYCGRAAPDVELHVDHAVSVADGGTSEASNLVASCVDCNLGKGARSIG